MDTQTIEELDTVEQTNIQTIESDVAHIIDRGDDERKAADIVLEARIMGTPLTALCGFTWVPAKDPQTLPVCEKCKEMFEFALDMRGML